MNLDEAGALSPSEVEPQGERRHWRYFAARLAVICLLGLPTSMIIQRVAYGDYWPFSLPQRIDYCGARYFQAHNGADGDNTIVGETQGLADSNGEAVSNNTEFLYAFTIYPAGLRVYRTNIWQCPESEQEQHSQFLFVQTGPDRYLELTDTD